MPTSKNWRHLFYRWIAPICGWSKRRDEGDPRGMPSFIYNELRCQIWPDCQDCAVLGALHAWNISLHPLNFVEFKGCGDLKCSSLQCWLKLKVDESKNGTNMDLEVASYADELIAKYPDVFHGWSWPPGHPTLVPNVRDEARRLSIPPFRARWFSTRMKYAAQVFNALPPDPEDIPDLETLRKTSSPKAFISNLWSRRCKMLRGHISMPHDLRRRCRNCKKRVRCWCPKCEKWMCWGLCFAKVHSKL